MADRGGEGGRKHPPFWVFSIYFAEGFPYSLVRQISTVFFKDLGASLEWVGFTSLYGLPWVFKFLWSPFADRYGTKRKWLVSTQLAITALLVAVSLLCLSSNPLVPVGIALLLLAFLSATNDIASDGYYLEALERGEQSRFVGYQAMSYRLALITGGGGVIYLSSKLGWSGGFFAATALFAVIFFAHAKLLPSLETEKEPFRNFFSAFFSRTFIVLLAAAALTGLFFQRNPEVLKKLPEYPIVPLSGIAIIVALILFPFFFPAIKRKLSGKDTFYRRAFLAYLDRPKIVPFLVFLVLYRLGESMILNMLYPMLKSIGLERGDYGIIYGTFGVAASIIGGITGGALISKFGLKRMAWFLVLMQNIPNLLYAWLASIYDGTADMDPVKFFVVSGFVVFEAFGAGLGTSFFMVLIMRSTLSEFKAANMATATGIMNLSASMVGLFSGKLASTLGFPVFFLATFIATVPAMILIPLLPFMEDKGNEEPS
ncbi:MAG TPA: MFS transporter [Acidobacteriota bacterium]|nr:MFS transporter [Acidobacteriota bacterium]HNT18009.1 MFS transporter [Acidobacteriota bacterium]HPA26632.1 MFS transporter [Acidobacteriota bacterium]HQO19482.1 MFS transporter [Acidobacteriota bacterium]HQQ45986.1 MFS transporter [Acidobacteriota bacterium]